MSPTVSTPLPDMYAQTLPNSRVLWAWAQKLLPCAGHVHGWHIGLEVGGQDLYAAVPEARQMAAAVKTVLWYPLTGFVGAVHTVSAEGLA